MHRSAARRPATRSAALSSSSIPSGMASSSALHPTYLAAARDEQHRSVPS